MSLTEKQKKFLELESRKEEIKKYYEDFEQALSDLVQEQGVNSYFQDHTGTVYKLVEAEGKYVKFDKYSYNRTKRPGEERGTLSVKEAKEHGFQVN